MKVSIGSKIINSAWGGGNSFAKNLSKYLQEKGFEVFFDLKEKNLDVIIMTDPRSSSISSNYDDIDIINYQKKNKKTLIIHRVNECDERKGTNFVNKKILKANRVSDHTVFISNWLKDLFKNHGLNPSNSSVIYNGADEEVYNFSKDNFLKEKIKLVTHHWSAHPNKGLRIYQTIDNLMDKPEWKDKIEFCYIGNISKGVKLQNTKIIKPLYGKELADKLKESNIYVSASLNEPAGMHHIEAAMCGLPILYVKSGALPEYCKNFGIGFEYSNFEIKLSEIIKQYQFYRKKLETYPYNSKNSCEQYYSLIKEIHKNRESIISQKKLPKLIFKDRILSLKRKLKKLILS